MRVFYELADTHPKHCVAFIPVAVFALYHKLLFSHSYSCLRGNAVCELHLGMSSMHM